MDMLNIPESLKSGFEELHHALARAARESGSTGETARAVAKLLHSHLEKEEEFALPLLGLLPALAAGPVTPEMRLAVALSESLKVDLWGMVDEHKAIAAALDALADAARQEGKAECARLAESLKLHLKTEEEVLYPAAILVGEFVKLRLAEEWRTRA